MSVDIHTVSSFLVDESDVVVHVPGLLTDLLRAMTTSEPYEDAFPTLRGTSTKLATLTFVKDRDIKLEIWLNNGMFSVKPASPKASKVISAEHFNSRGGSINSAFLHGADQLHKHLYGN